MMSTKDCIYQSGKEIYDGEKELLETLGYEDHRSLDMRENICNETYISSIKHDFNDAYRILVHDRNDGIVRLIIDFAVNGEEERYIRALLEQMEREHSLEYGLIITSQKLLLINCNVRTSKLTGEKWKKSKIVLEAEYRNRQKERFLKFFSYQSIFSTKNTAYFKDIADYRNDGFKGKEGSWPLYESTLYNFFLYYSEKKSSYRENIYEIITADDYIDFVQDVSMASSRALKSPHTLCNKFSYLKGFILYQAPNNIDFQKARREIEEAVCNLEKKKKRDLLDDEHIQVMEAYFKKNKNSVRNQCILYLLLFYGMERKKLAALKWSDFDFTEGGGKIITGEYVKALPKGLEELLMQLKQENERAGVTQEYLFYARGAKGPERLKDSSINEIFRRIEDSQYAEREFQQFSPQYIRKGLVRYLLEDKKCSLEEIMCWLDIDVENLKSYISNEELHRIVSKRNSKHPPIGSIKK